jgi:glucose/arabinose dehydrogenase
VTQDRKEVKTHESIPDRTGHDRCSRRPRWRRGSDRQRGVEHVHRDDADDDRDNSVHDHHDAVDGNRSQRNPVGQLPRYVTTPGARRGAAAAAAALLACAVAGSASAGSGLVSIGSGLKGPAGLKATVYATGLQHLSALAVGSDGRVWATTSAATDHADDGIYVIPRAHAKPVLVARVAEPLGLTWIGNSLYVAARGKVYAYSKLVGDRFERRTLILDGPDTKAANDTIVELPSGRLLLSVSATCDHCAQSSPYSAAIVSFNKDGSGLRVYARGIRDGYGLALYPGTSTLLVSINQRDDLGARTPGDWLAAVRSGENWGFPGCYGQGGAVCRGVPKPLAVLDRHAGAGAVAILTGGLGGVGTAAIVTEWATGKVKIVPLNGSSHTAPTRATVFLTGLKNPLAVKSTAAGLLVGDWTTGRVYSITQR